MNAVAPWVVLAGMVWLVATLLMLAGEGWRSGRPIDAVAFLLAACFASKSGWWFVRMVGWVA